jgi:hypothetical protein
MCITACNSSENCSGQHFRSIIKGEEERNNNKKKKKKKKK